MRLAIAVIAAASASGWLVCDPMAHGAAGNGLVYDTAAVRAAVDECGAAGGGTVHFPAGRIFLTGCFNVSSNTQLLVDGTILGSPNSTDYVLVDYLPWYGPDPPQALAGASGAAAADTREWQPLIQSWYASNVSIAGTGVIDGQGAPWWGCASNSSRPPCNGYPRPHGIRLVGGSHFSLTGVTVKNSPMWQIHLAFVTDVHVHDMQVLAPSNSHNSEFMFLRAHKKTQRECGECARVRWCRWSEEGVTVSREEEAKHHISLFCSCSCFFCSRWNRP